MRQRKKRYAYGLKWTWRGRFFIVIEKAKELGRSLRETKEYQKLEAAEQNLNDDPDAQLIIQDVQKVQQDLDQLQESGLEPSQEQMKTFNEKRQQMSNNPAIKEFFSAQSELSELIKEVNKAISEGMTGEEQN